MHLIPGSDVHFEKKMRGKDILLLVFPKLFPVPLPNQETHPVFLLCLSNYITGALAVTNLLEFLVVKYSKIIV